jgi:hypothetical protein
MEKQEYKITIRKGNSYREVKKVILKNVIDLWAEILNECSSDEDYLFTRNLQPSTTATQPYQITKRWKRLVKDKYSVTSDFYALKHLFLDEIDRLSYANSNISKDMASHETNVTETVYLVGRNDRKNEALKNMDVDLFGAV